MADPFIIADTEALDCDGYRKLLAAVEKDELRGSRAHDYRRKLKWVIDRARHYAEKTGLTPEAILDLWESKRSYWYMNYYQDANQPKLDSAHVRVFLTVDELRASIGEPRFRCPYCKGVSTQPSQCNSGLEVDLIDGKRGTCNWKAWGLFGDLGKGVHLFCVEKMASQLIFMPIAWEQEQESEVANDQG